MRNFLLFVSCFLLILIYPVCTSDMNTHGVESGVKHLTKMVENDSSDILYDQDMATLMVTYDLQNDDFTASHLHRISRQLRLLSVKMQHRQETIILLIKQLTNLLSSYLTNLVKHTTSFYSTLKMPCWQYAADCYVFAFRHIII